MLLSRSRGPAMRNLAILACLLAIPPAAFGQAAIVGSVTDPSGAALPGVTVEAVSPALIEKTRKTITDADGRYRLENLRPGSYGVEFTLPGWKTHRLEGVELTGSFTATVDAQLAVGDLADSI